MKRINTLESRLTDWGSEYGGPRYENVGWQGMSPLAALIKYNGRPPQGLNPRRVDTSAPCDKVEEAVKALQEQDRGLIPACVLRCEYFAISQNRLEKIARLNKVGQLMGSVRYSQHLRIAKVHVAAWLHLQFDEACDEENAIGILELITGA